MTFSFDPAAEEEFVEAIAYLEDQQEGLGLDLSREVFAAIQRIVRHPEAWPLYTKGTRRCLTKRFSYAVIYQTEQESILIWAIAIHPRGFIPKPKGKMISPRGFAPKPEGKMIYPRGFIPKPGGKMISPRGFILKPEGKMLFPTGKIISPPKNPPNSPRPNPSTQEKSPQTRAFSQNQAALAVFPRFAAHSHAPLGRGWFAKGYYWDVLTSLSLAA